MMEIDFRGPPEAGSASPASSYHPTQERQPAPSRAKRKYQRRINRDEYLEKHRERMRLRRQAEANRLPMDEYLRTMICRRAKIRTILTELASLDQRQVDAGRLLGMSSSVIHRWCKTLDIKLCAYAETPLMKAVRRGFGNKTYREIAAEMNTSAKVVGVTACKLGLTNGARHDPAKFSRGFHIPDEKWPEYMALRREFNNAMTAVETGMCMGLLPRPSIQGNQP
jgi:hypothetical protein